MLSAPPASPWHLPCPSEKQRKWKKIEEHEERKGKKKNQEHEESPRLQFHSPGVESGRPFFFFFFL